MVDVVVLTKVDMLLIGEIVCFLLGLYWLSVRARCPWVASYECKAKSWPAKNVEEAKRKNFGPI